MRQSSSAGNGLSTAIFQTFVVGIINFLFAFVAVLGVDRFGRRALYMVCSTGMTLSLILLSVGFFNESVKGIYGLTLILIIYRLVGIVHSAWVLDIDVRDVPNVHSQTRDVIRCASQLDFKLPCCAVVFLGFSAYRRSIYICPSSHEWPSGCFL
jgi:hypothetical protein